LRRYAWSLLRNSSDVDDLVQECLVRALAKGDARVSDGDVRPWLFKIMHNLFISRWRRMNVRVEEPLDEAAAELAMPASQPASAEMQDALRGLSTLPKDQQHVLLLVAVEGLEYAEVADVLGVPIGTVMSRLSRARDHLRDFMEGRERPKLWRAK
jgi:RNA polymerase sigma-70 factor, ECF subfamily